MQRGAKRRANRHDRIRSTRDAHRGVTSRHARFFEYALTGAEVEFRSRA
ncbi:hypothetical protein PNP03_02615 [Halobacterium salinarum]|nr:hypothetical protein [Halobacterium salinarum]